MIDKSRREEHVRILSFVSGKVELNCEKQNYNFILSKTCAFMFIANLSMRRFNVISESEFSYNSSWFWHQTQYSQRSVSTASQLSSNVRAFFVSTISSDTSHVVSTTLAVSWGKLRVVSSFTSFKHWRLAAETLLPRPSASSKFASKGYISRRCWELHFTQDTKEIQSHFPENRGKIFYGRPSAQ
jgi:hypothetical protein